MKRPFSLLEVCIGLALTAILLTALFSSFRHLMKTGVQIESARAELHGGHLLDLRLNQIFESLSPGKLFYTHAHDHAYGDALYFTFNNGLDPDPEYCGEIDGVLFLTNEKDPSICLLLKDQREEVFVEGVEQLSFEFFDSSENAWKKSWDKKFLPPMLRIKINGRTYSYILPKAERRLTYS